MINKQSPTTSTKKLKKLNRNKSHENFKLKDLIPKLNSNKSLDKLVDQSINIINDSVNTIVDDSRQLVHNKLNEIDLIRNKRISIQPTEIESKLIKSIKTDLTQANLKEYDSITLELSNKDKKMLIMMLDNIDQNRFWVDKYNIKPFDLFIKSEVEFLLMYKGRQKFAVNNKEFVEKTWNKFAKENKIKK